MTFIEDLDENKQDSYQEKHQRMQQELQLLAEFRILNLCRICFLLFMVLLAIRTSVGSSHVPVSVYATGAYFLAAFVLSEHNRRQKTQEFLLKSLRVHYRYQYNQLLTMRYCFFFSFVLLAAIQFAFSHNILLGDPYLTYSPIGFVLFQLLLRYAGAWALNKHMNHRLHYPH